MPKKDAYKATYAKKASGMAMGIQALGFLGEHPWNSRYVMR